MPSAGDRMRAPVQRGVRASRAVKRNGQSAVQGLLGPRKCHCSKGLGDGCQRLPERRAGSRPKMPVVPSTENLQDGASNGPDGRKAGHSHAVSQAWHRPERDSHGARNCLFINELRQNPCCSENQVNNGGAL